MSGKLTWEQILLIFVGIVIVVWFVRWLVCRNKSATSQSSQSSQTSQSSTVHPTQRQLPARAIIQNQPNQPNQPIQSESKFNTPFTLYYFYNPGCGYCIQFESTWTALKQKLSGIHELSMIAVNASISQNDNLVFYYNIRGYPTIILSTPSKNVEYTGSRELNDLVEFVASHIKEETS